MLSPYRVLDLSDERGALCGQILADLGADVIKVEPPGGSRERAMAPFAGDARGHDRSLVFWSCNRGKRGITLDIDAPGGRDELLRLVATADFLIESHAPGYLATRGLGYDDLAAANPALICVSITPFGQTGPKARYAATELTVLAAGGLMALQGDDDRAPVRCSVPQGWSHAAAEAAGAALLALRERARSGLGQHVDVSAQQAVMQATFSSQLAPPNGARPATRYAGGLRDGRRIQRYVWDAKDGHVSITFLFGTAIGPMTRRLMDYVHDEGFCDEATRDKDWVNYSALLRSGEETLEEYERVKACVNAMTRTKTKAELFAAARERNLLIAPAEGADEVCASDQLEARDYWRGVAHGGIEGPVRYPGPFARFSATPIIYRRPPPSPGEHNAEVRAERRPPPPRGRTAPDALPLAGLKVLDFMWVMAGPAATRVLADYGATVVHVETARRIDTARTLAPMMRGEPSPEKSGLYQNINAGKLGVALDMSTDAGREVARDLVRWADAITESYSPRAMRRWGLDYENVRALNPRAVMLSSCLMGQTGPLADFAGFGNLAAALSGFYKLVGWPDRAPAGPFGAYTDTVAPRFTVAALLAALDHRDRTGEGQYIDQSQVESALHFLSPALLDYTVNGRVETRAGNRDPNMAPHGVYPCAGDDTWIAIAVTGGATWRALCEAIGRRDAASEQRYATLAGRLAAHDEIDVMIEAWTSGQERYAAERALQAAGVASSVVQNGREMWEDEHLRARGAFVQAPHHLHGSVTVEGPRARLSRTPGAVRAGAPTMGEHTLHVLRDFLGYAPDRIEELALAGVLE